MPNNAPSFVPAGHFFILLSNKRTKFSSISVSFSRFLFFFFRPFGQSMLNSLSPTSPSNNTQINETEETSCRWVWLTSNVSTFTSLSLSLNGNELFSSGTTIELIYFVPLRALGSIRFSSCSGRRRTRKTKCVRSKVNTRDILPLNSASHLTQLYRFVPVSMWSSRCSFLQTHFSGNISRKKREKHQSIRLARRKMCHLFFFFFFFFFFNIPMCNSIFI